jgi:glutathione S-transferase
VTLVLHQHPFASYCQKALIALYELDLPFRTHLVDDADARSELAATLWPMASIPVLRDESADLTLPESTTIIEYLDDVAADGPKLIPADRAEALQARLWDRFFDQHVATPMQKIVGDSLRSEGRNDPEGVVEARSTLDPTPCSTPGSPIEPGRQAPRSRWPTARPRRRCSMRAPSIAGTRMGNPTSRATTAT